MRTRIFIVALCAMVLFVGGCFSHKTAPGIAINPEIPRDAYEVLDTVEGTSTTDSILFGLIQVVDGNKLRLLWIPFFKEQHSYFEHWEPPPGPIQYFIRIWIANIAASPCL